MPEEIRAKHYDVFVSYKREDDAAREVLCNALKSAGQTVGHCFVLFYYDIFPDRQKLFKELGVELHYLTTFQEVLEAARATGDFDPGVLREVEAFLKEPAKWSATHGGISDFNAKPAAA